MHMGAFSTEGQVPEQTRQQTDKLVGTNRLHNKQQIQNGDQSELAALIFPF